MRMNEEEGPGGGDEDQGGGAVLIRIHVPDLNIHKCLQFYRHDLVWDVKQQCLASLPKVTHWYGELKESFNYGLFAPPCNGKAGKFLDEERPLTDYPFSGPVGYLELRYKRRLYKGLNVDEKHLKALHSKSNLRRFLDYVASGHCEKISKMCGKGLDPNFHCPETGETPLTMGAVMKKPSKLLIALVNGGALLDYRTREGSTSMHRAVEAKSLEAVKTLLNLGGSPNYRDGKGLTPLYLSVATNADPALCEALLHDHAFVGAQDQQGWNETHQACRNGLVQHLEHLLYYGSDMNAKNASGNTPLHVCAVNNQESCARLLLFRGADKEALNFANQTPYQVAVIAGNMELAEIIQNHRPQDVVPFRDLPKYNPKRRSVISRALSLNPRGSMTCMTGRAGSPCPSNRSLPPFSSASSILSDVSAHTPTGSCSDSSYSDSHFGSEDNSAITDKSLDHSDITSDSSGVGTCNSGGSSYDQTPTDNSLVLPGMMVVCVENYRPSGPGHLQLAEGDIIEVTASTDSGYLEGSLRGQMGFFPAACVQEIRMKSYENRNHLAPPHGSKTKGKNDGKTQYASVPRLKKIWGEARTVILHRGQKGFGFVIRGAKSDSPLMDLQPSDRFPALQYLDDVDGNGVADRAGLRKGDFILSINGTDVSQCSHEIVVDCIRKSGDLVQMTVIGLSLPSAAQMDNCKPGSPASLTCDQGGTPKAQYHFATLPRKYSGSSGPSVPSPPRRDPTTSLSIGRARAKSMVAALADLGANDADPNVGAKSNSVDSIGGGSKPPLPPNAANAPNSNGGIQPKTASIRARPTSSRITAADFPFPHKPENGGKKESYDGKSPPSPLAAPPHKIYASVAEMKRLKGGSKKEIGSIHKDFHSTPDLKALGPKKEEEENVESPDIPKGKCLSQENIDQLRANPRHSWACISPGKNGVPPGEECGAEKAPTPPPPPPPDEDGNESDPSTATGTSPSDSSDEDTPKPLNSSTPKGSVLTEGEYRTIKPLRPVQSKTLPRRASTGCTIGPAEQQNIINLVPPGQVIKVDVSKSQKEYGSLDIGSQTLGRRDHGMHIHGGAHGAGFQGAVMSSFKPNDSAKLYASPDDLRSIGYREPGAESGTLKKRSQSLPPGKQEGRKGGDYAMPDRRKEETNGDKKEETFDPQKSLMEAKEKLRPVLKNHGGESQKIRIEVKQSPRLARKVEKSVKFQSEEPPPSTSSTISHSMSVDEIQKVKTSLKSSKSFPNDLLGQEEGETLNHGTEAPGSNGNFVTTLPVNPDSDSSEDSSDKTWILKDESSSEAPTVIHKMAQPSHTTLTINSPPDVLSGVKRDGKEMQGGVHVKVASSYYGSVMIAPGAPQGSNPTNSPVAPDLYGTLGGPGRSGQQAGHLTKNAVSLAKLPPPMESESEAEEGKGMPKPLKSILTQGASYHTLQPQRSRSMLADPQQPFNSRHFQPQQPTQAYQQSQTLAPRQAEKSIEESLKLIQMHVAALKQEFPSVVPPPPEFGVRNTPILAPPPEFSDARDTHESSTRFNQNLLYQGGAQGAAQGGAQGAAQGDQPFNRQSPMYRSISHTHSSGSSMYSGYPTMTRQQYNQHLLQQHQQQQAQQQQAQLQHHQKQMQQIQQQQHQQHQQQQQHQHQQQHQQQTNQHGIGMPLYQTLGRHSSYSNATNSPSLLNQSGYGIYQTLAAPSKQQQPLPPAPTTISGGSGAPSGHSASPASLMFPQQHHPKCHFYQQTSSQPSSNANSSTGQKYIPEKLHPVHRYTPDIYESTPRIVGTIPKKQPGSDHYEVPHAHQQQLLQQQQLNQQQQQQQQPQQGTRIRREFRNKNLVDWSVMDSCDWLDSLVLPEYKGIFQQRAIDGKKLTRMDNAMLLEIGVKKLGHRMNIEKSLKRYMPSSKN